MKKAVLALALAGLLSLGAFAVGCDSGSTGGNTGGTNVDQDKDSGPNNDQGGEQDKDKEEQPAERKLRVLEKDFKYTVRTKEFPVKYDDIEIFGQLWEPKEKGKYPLVILSHGFNGHYTDFPLECKRLAERGYVAYAFDFCGAQQGGKSTGRTADTYTPLTMKEDVINIVQTLTKQLSEVDKTQVFLFGGSQGGFVTALAAADERVKDVVSAIALYFPAFNIPDDWHGKPEVKTSLMGYFIGADFIKSRPLCHHRELQEGRLHRLGRQGCPRREEVYRQGQGDVRGQGGIDRAPRSGTRLWRRGSHEGRRYRPCLPRSENVRNSLNGLIEKYNFYSKTGAAA